MARTACAAVAVLFGVNVSCAGESALESLRASVSPSVLSGIVLLDFPAAEAVPLKGGNKMREPARLNNQEYHARGAKAAVGGVAYTGYFSVKGACTPYGGPGGNALEIYSDDGNFLALTSSGPTDDGQGGCRQINEIRDCASSGKPSEIQFDYLRGGVFKTPVKYLTSFKCLKSLSSRGGAPVAINAPAVPDPAGQGANLDVRKVFPMPETETWGGPFTIQFRREAGRDAVLDILKGEGLEEGVKELSDNGRGFYARIAMDDEFAWVKVMRLVDYTSVTHVQVNKRLWVR